MKCFICSSNIPLKEINSDPPFCACADCTKELSIYSNINQKKIETIFNKMSELQFNKAIK